MKKIIIVSLLLALLLGVAGSLILKANYGYILITADSWSIEKTLSEFIIFPLSVALIAFYFIARLAFKLLFLPSTLRAYMQRKRAERSRRNITQGLIELIEGRPRKAERTLLRDIEYSDAKLLHYLLAARAAQVEDANDRRDEYLKKAHEAAPEADIAIGLTQAELQLTHQQTEQALATLSHLRELAPKNAYVLKLLVRLHVQLNEWDKLIILLPEIRKRRLLSDKKLDDLERNTYSQFLMLSSHTKPVSFLQAQWKKFPVKYRSTPEVVRIYANALMRKKAHAEAEKVIYQFLAWHWDEELIYLYGLIVSDDLPRQLDRAEALLKEHTRSAMLFLTLGRLCHKLQLWGKARSYYDSSISIHATTGAYKELGDLHHARGDFDKANQCWRKGLDLAIQHTDDRRINDKKRQIRSEDLTLSDDLPMQANPVLADKLSKGNLR